jgi:hypothetical protein
MPITRKKSAKKRLSKKAQKTVVVIEQPIEARDTIFPEKVARANKILSNTKFHDPNLNR